MSPKEMIDAGDEGVKPAGESMEDDDSSVVDGLDLSEVKESDIGDDGELKTPDEKSEETDDEEGAEDTGEEETTGEPEMDVFDSEQALLEAKGVKGHESVEKYVEANSQAVAEIQEVLRSMDIDTKASNLQELRDEFVQAAVAAEKAGGSPPAAGETGTKLADPPPGVDLKSFMKQYGSDMEAGADKFYTDFASAVAQHVQDSLKTSVGDVTSRLDKSDRANDVVLDRMWYNEAVAAAGDGPKPSFSQSRALLKNSGELRSTAKLMLTKFGNSNHNPMTTIIDTYRASKTASGVTNAQAEKADANAKKVAIHKGLIKATPAGRAGATPFAKLPVEQQEKIASRMPA